MWGNSVGFFFSLPLTLLPHRTRQLMAAGAGVARGGASRSLSRPVCHTFPPPFRRAPPGLSPSARRHRFGRVPVFRVTLTAPVCRVREATPTLPCPSALRATPPLEPLHVYRRTGVAAIPALCLPLTDDVMAGSRREKWQLGGVWPLLSLSERCGPPAIDTPTVGPEAGGASDVEAPIASGQTRASHATPRGWSEQERAGASRVLPEGVRGLENWVLEPPRQARRPAGRLAGRPPEQPSPPPPARRRTPPTKHTSVPRAPRAATPPGPAVRARPPPVRVRP